VLFPKPGGEKMNFSGGVGIDSLQDVNERGERVNSMELTGEEQRVEMP
jgi:hypothetical protein